MRTRALIGITAFLLAVGFAVRGDAAVIELYEDDPAIIDALAGAAGGAVLESQTADVYNGSAALRMTGEGNDAQRYSEMIEGWEYPIVENPAGANEARWLMLAWKKPEGLNGIMIQFPDNGAWGAVSDPFVDPPAPGTRRYIAGENITGWSGIQVAPDAPADWALVTRDLYADFGEFVLTGMALTAFAGVGYYDAIYLGATEAEVLSAIGGPPTAVEPQGKLTTTWANMKTR